MEKGVLRLQVVVTINEDGTAEAYCPDLELKRMASTPDEAISELLDAISSFLDIPSQTEIDFEEDIGGLPYYGPSGGLN